MTPYEAVDHGSPWCHGSSSVNTPTSYVTGSDFQVFCVTGHQVFIAYFYCCSVTQTIIR